MSESESVEKQLISSIQATGRQLEDFRVSQAHHSKDGIVHNLHLLNGNCKELSSRIDKVGSKMHESNKAIADVATDLSRIATGLGAMRNAVWVSAALIAVAVGVQILGLR